MFLWKGHEEIKQTLFVIVNFCLTKLRYINILKGMTHLFKIND